MVDRKDHANIKTMVVGYWDETNKYNELDKSK